MINLDEPRPAGGIALFHLGFRPFFLGAALFSVVATLLWMGIYVFAWRSKPLDISPATWHAHEMIFGYSVAVIAGFLLTAVKNWTGVQTPHRTPLVFLFLLWLAGRILPFFSDAIPVAAIAVVDSLFLVFVFLAVIFPIVRARQWKQIGIASKILLMLASNVVFYLGVADVLDKGVNWGLYSGLYLILALIFTMGRRVIPFFIERGVDETVQLSNYKWLDISSLVLFVAFWITDVFVHHPNLAAVLAGMLFLLHGIRLAGWYTPAMWRKPLLWVLYIAYGFLVVGFLLKAAVPVFNTSSSLATHAFTVGGIGVMTLGMMSRVALGHTGRNIAQPPPVLSWIFVFLIAAALFRVVLPLVDSGHYLLWVGLSQGLWILSFMVFVVVYLPILLQPRVDGKYG
ncbi:MAG: NnrS family protein [Acidithiobacillales bacterium SG8_45]|jgi:uncharacterized protein involved in response to NO|nr:MAG: NnrS family protein [Acidithiobacillales bacterium SG8_45]